MQAFSSFRSPTTTGSIPSLDLAQRADHTSNSRTLIWALPMGVLVRLQNRSLVVTNDTRIGERQDADQVLNAGNLHLSCFCLSETLPGRWIFTTGGKSDPLLAIWLLQISPTSALDESLFVADLHAILRAAQAAAGESKGKMHTPDTD